MSVVSMLVSDFGVSRLTYYVGDFCIFMLLLYICWDNGLAKLRQIKNMKSALVFFTCLIILSFILNIYSPVLLIWGIRSYFRFFIFFIAVVLYLKEEDVEEILNILFIILILNVLISTYQYFALGLRNDYVGGTFGTEKGCNAYTNILLLVLSSYALMAFLNKRKSIFYTVMVLVFSMYIAALSELKGFYIEFAIIAAFGMIISKPNKRTISMIVVGGVILFFGARYFMKQYNIFENFFNLESIVYYMTDGSYSFGADKVNRLSGIIRIQNMFLDDGLKKLFGIGLGNADYSSYFMSDVYRQYGYLRYTWFLSTFLFLELGYLGLISYILIFIATIMDLKRIHLFFENKSKELILTSILIALCTIVIVFYNSSSRMDCAYILFGALGFGFCRSGNVIGNRKKKIIIKIN
jgi:hypothetical protein